MARIEGHGPAVVIDEHTLAVPIGSDYQILRASVLRGSPFPADGCIPCPQPTRNVRPATRQDFADYGVAWHPDYTEPES